MQQDNVSELARRRSNRWMRMLQPPLPVWHNTAAREQLIPLGTHNLYIGGAGNQVSGYINVDLVALPGVDVVCDAENLPFRDETLDRIDCEAVIEHTPDPMKLLAEIHRCLKKGGGCRVVAPFCHPFHEYPSDYWRFSIDGLHRLVAPMRVGGRRVVYRTNRDVADRRDRVRQIVDAFPVAETGNLVRTRVAAIFLCDTWTCCWCVLRKRGNWVTTRTSGPGNRQDLGITQMANSRDPTTLGGSVRLPTSALPAMGCRHHTDRNAPGS